MISQRKILNTIGIIFLTYCIQFTDLKIGVVKVSEIILLFVAPYFLSKKTNKYIAWFLLFFTVVLFISLVKTATLDFQHLGNSFLKAPYLISLSRYLELICCLTLCSLTYSFFKSLNQRSQRNEYINKLVNLNILITLLFFAINLLVINGLIHMDETRIVYGWSSRLRGYFVEGGPYGLMLAFIFILSGYTKKLKYKFIKRLFLAIVILFFAKSKAGILCVVVWLCLENYGYFKKALKASVYPLIVFVAAAFYFLFVNISYMYVDEIENIKTSVAERPNDTNITMGRIASVFIVPKMIKENFFFGIGTGNYALLRNNDEYRTFLPLQDEKVLLLDAHGLGGIMDIFIDNGFFGLLFFSVIMYVIYNHLKRDLIRRRIMLGFLVIFIFGVQIYFLYPWILLGIALSGEDQKPNHT